MMGETVDMQGSRKGQEPSEPATTDEMKVYVDVLKRELDEEFRIAERLDAKARGYLTATTVAVAATQAAAIALIVQVRGVVGIIAAFGAVIVLTKIGTAVYRVLVATRTHESEAFDIDYARSLLPFVYHGEPVAIHNLADVMLRTLKDRRRANGERQKDVADALDAAKFASTLIAIELGVIVVAVGVDGVL